MMKIVADENIPFLDECFGQLGEVVALNGRHLTHEDVLDADALIVRSVTPVTRALLDGSSVRFVGTCTIGIDHVDTDYLDEKCIAFASAPGSNAGSASQYVISALVAMAQRHHFLLADTTLGIIGHGNVGSRVSHLAHLLGMKVLVCDPPLKERGHEGLEDLEAVLQADIITFHVPLTHTGKYPTYHMIDTALLEKMNPNAMLINTARGDIINIPALKKDIGRHGRKVVLDVWPNEPRIDEELLSMIQIGTPHIAGYSHDGKLKGTEMVYQALCHSMGIECPPVNTDNHEFSGQTLSISVTEQASLQDAVKEAVLHSYPILEDDKHLRELLNEPPEQQGLFFDNLRRQYGVRREYQAYQYRGPHSSTLYKMGFQEI